MSLKILGSNTHLKLQLLFTFYVLIFKKMTFYQIIVEKNMAKLCTQPTLDFNMYIDRDKIIDKLLSNGFNTPPPPLPTPRYMIKKI